ncbi:hypothetical protein ACFQS1_07425 [Paractinoplanes rhizophilus]|uniref:HD domain-containing protein n=1 Tax=Paractinoplanes rhizophilus TaxID=1416877 RepID=A0ABW2HKQ1_9ACTN
MDSALLVARRWCSGQIIDDRPALAHAVRVAVTIGVHQPIAAPQIIAAALLHDAPEFAPPDLDLDRFLSTEYGPEVRRLIRGMQFEHDALDRDEPTIPDPDDVNLILLSTADKVVALTSLLRRAHLSGDTAAFFTTRTPLLNLLTHFSKCRRAAIGAVPASMTADLGKVLDALGTATAVARRRQAARS